MKPRGPSVPIGSERARPGAKVGDVVTIAGLAVTVASQAQGERAALVVCIGLTVPLTFADNRTGPCADCGDTLQWRPHAPRKPPKLCMDCATIRILKDGRRG